MGRGAYPACIILILACLAVPAVSAAALTISAAPATAHSGDTIILNGTVTGLNVIAVYLFVSGPDLDARGVTLENLNMPAGRGMFTTAPVHMDDGSWTYTWDTAVILGSLGSGTYTVTVLSHPVDRLRSAHVESATANIEILPSTAQEPQAPASPVLPVIALLVAAGVCGLVCRRER